MSKDKAEEKAREYAIKKYGDELIFHEPYLETLGDFKAGYTQAVTDLSAENAQLREALRELVDDIEESKIDRKLANTHVYKTLITPEIFDKAKQLLTDKE